MRSLIASPSLQVRMDLSKLVARYGICDNMDRPEGVMELIESAYREGGPYDVIFVGGFPDLQEMLVRVRGLEKRLFADEKKARIITVDGATAGDAALDSPFSEQSVLQALGPLNPEYQGDR